MIINIKIIAYLPNVVEHHQQLSESDMFRIEIYERLRWLNGGKKGSLCNK